MFVESAHHRLGSQATVDDLADMGTEDMLSYGPYEDGSKNRNSQFQGRTRGNVQVRPISKYKDITLERG